MIDEKNDVLVTVVCSSYKYIQQLQSYSIDKFIEKPCDHYVVIEDSAMSLEQWYAMLSPYYTRHRLILLESLLPQSAYQNDTPKKNGWHRSSLLKLFVAKHITQPRYLILDCKNFFVRPTVLQDWPCKEGNNVVLEISKVMPPWPNLNKFCQDYNIHMPEKSWSSVTPFMVKTDIVKSLIEYEDLYPMFLSNLGYSSELILYSVFAQHCGSNLQEGPTVNITFWGDENNLTKETFDNFYNWPNLKTMGLHRYTFKFNDDLIELKDWLVGKGFDKFTVENCLDNYQQDIINKHQ